MMTHVCNNQKGKPDGNCRSGLTGLMSPKFFKALCDPNRISILARMAACCEPASVGEIADCCTVDLSVVSRHLSVLRDAGILEAEKRGKQVYYSVRYGAIAGILRTMADAIEACCPDPESVKQTTKTPLKSNQKNSAGKKEKKDGRKR